MRDYKNELKDDIAYCKENGVKVVLVEANPEKGFNYSYFLYIPNNPQNTIMMDYLNDDSLRISTEQEATKVIRETVLGKEKSLYEKNNIKQYTIYNKR